MRPKLPWGPRPRKPGAGLGQLFSDEEAPTTKHKAIPPRPSTPPAGKFADGSFVCPVCRGAGDLHVTPYALQTCPLCRGERTVTRAVFDKYIADHPDSVAARQFKKKT